MFKLFESWNSFLEEDEIPQSDAPKESILMKALEQAKSVGSDRVYYNKNGIMFLITIENKRIKMYQTRMVPVPDSEISPKPEELIRFEQNLGLHSPGGTQGLIIPGKSK